MGILRGLEVNDVVFVNPIYLPNGSLLSSGRYKITKVSTELNANSDEKIFKYNLLIEPYNGSRTIVDVPDFIPCEFMYNDVDEADFSKSVKEFDEENK